MGAFVKHEIRSQVVAALALAASLASPAYAADRIIATTGGMQDTWDVHQSVDAKGVATCYASSRDSPVTIVDGYYKYVIPQGAAVVHLMGSAFGGIDLPAPLMPKPPRIMSDSVRWEIAEIKGTQWVRVGTSDKLKKDIGPQGIMRSTPGSEAAMAKAAAACPTTWIGANGRHPADGQISPQISAALAAIPSTVSPKAPAPTPPAAPVAPVPPSPARTPTAQGVGALCSQALVVRMRAYPLPELGISQLCNAPAQPITSQGVGALCSAMLVNRMRQSPIPEMGIAQICQ
jgi:hypothetical protein